MDNKESSDLLGLKPVGDAINTTVTKTFEGIQGFLTSVCVPALDEIGLMMKDNIRHWRLNNILRILEKSKGRLEFENENLQIKAHPRVALSIIENGSLSDNDEVQELWAGLFVSSCTKSGQDDENLIFVDLLKQLTIAEAKILKYSSENCRKIIHPNGLVTGYHFNIKCADLIEVTGIKDIHRLDRELDHLRSLELIGLGWSGGGFSAEDIELIADISPTSLALNLYVRSQGFSDSMRLYWNDCLVSFEQIQDEEREREKLEKKTTRKT